MSEEIQIQGLATEIQTLARRVLELESGDRPREHEPQASSIVPPSPPPADVSTGAAGDDGQFDELERMLRAQQVEIDNLRMQLRLATEDDPHRRPQRFIFLASKSGTTWQERGISNGAIVNFADGRVVTADSAKGALISRGGNVFLYETQDEHGRRYIEIGGDQSVTFRITSIVAGSVGMYNAKSIPNPVDTAATGALTEVDLGTINATEDLVVWHTPEIKLAAAKHMLVADGAHYVGADTGLLDGSGKRIVKFSVMPVGETASPTALGSATEGTTTADTTTWSRATNGTPLVETYVSRVVYDHAGDKTLYAMMRTRKLDACGLCYEVSAETAVSVDVAGPC